MHRRVDSGQHRRERGRQVLRSIPLWSDTLGLSGRADAVEVGDGAVHPVEYKSGMPHGNSASLQLCAQGICLEEMLGLEVKEGSVWFGGLRRRHRVVFTANLRQEVREIVWSIRQQILEGALPDAPNDERCAECQLLGYCLPELTCAPQRVNKYLADLVFRCAT